MKKLITFIFLCMFLIIPVKALDGNRDFYSVEWISDKLEDKEKYDLLKNGNEYILYTSRMLQKFTIDGELVDTYYIGGNLEFVKEEKDYYIFYTRGYTYGIATLNGTSSQYQYGIVMVSKKSGKISVIKKNSFVYNKILSNQDGKYVYYYLNRSTNKTEIRYGYFENYDFKYKVVDEIDGLYNLEFNKLSNYDNHYQYIFNIMAKDSYTTHILNSYFIDVDKEYKLNYSHEFETYYYGFNFWIAMNTGSTSLYRIGPNEYAYMNIAMNYTGSNSLSCNDMNLKVAYINTQSKTFSMRSDVLSTSCNTSNGIGIYHFPFDSISTYNNKNYMVVDKKLYEITDTGFNFISSISTQELATNYKDYAPFFYNYYYNNTEKFTATNYISQGSTYFDGFGSESSEVPSRYYISYRDYYYPDDEEDNEDDYYDDDEYLPRFVYLRVYDTKDEKMMFERKIPFPNSYYSDYAYTLVEDKYVVLFQKQEVDSDFYVFDLEGNLLMEKKISTFINGIDKTYPLLLKGDGSDLLLGIGIGNGRNYAPASLEVGTKLLPTFMSDEEYDYDDFPGYLIKLTHSYNVSVKVRKGKGNLTVTKDSALQGEKIKFTVTPSPGYVLKEVKVTDIDGKKVTFKTNTFVMPSADVIVEAVFVKSNIKNPDTSTLNVIMFVSGLIVLFVGIVLLMKKNLSRIYKI